MRKANPKGGFGWKKTGSWSLRYLWSSNESLPLRGLDMSVVPDERHGMLKVALGGYPIF